MRINFEELETDFVVSKYLNSTDGVWCLPQAMVFLSRLKTNNLLKLWINYLNPVYIEKKIIYNDKSKVIIEDAWLNFDFWHYLNTGKLMPFIETEKYNFFDLCKQNQKDSTINSLKRGVQFVYPSKFVYLPISL